MQHLTLEALARLVDEPPDAAEAEHLGSCEACRAELEALRRDTEALGRLGSIEPAGAEWAALEARLAREGLIAGPAGARRSLAATWTPRLLRLAAALALYAVGAASGLPLRSRQPATVAVSPPTTSATEAPSPQPTTATSPQVAVAEPPADTPSDTEPSGTRQVAQGGDAAEPATSAEALRAVRAAEQQYLQAYSRYAELTSAQQQGEDLVARAAALESFVLTSRAALDRAPADPVINGFHLTAVAQRDAALRQIALRSNGPWF